jgi:hypothetical protein
VGIELDVRSYEFATMYADVLKGNFQLFSCSGSRRTLDMLRRVFTRSRCRRTASTAVTRTGGRSLTDAAMAAPADEERRRLHGEARDRRGRAAYQPPHKTNTLSCIKTEGVKLTPR